MHEPDTGYSRFRIRIPYPTFRRRRTAPRFSATRARYRCSATHAPRRVLSHTSRKMCEPARPQELAIECEAFSPAATGQSWSTVTRQLLRQRIPSSPSRISTSSFCCCGCCTGVLHRCCSRAPPNSLSPTSTDLYPTPSGLLLGSWQLVLRLRLRLQLRLRLALRLATSRNGPPSTSC